MKTNLLLSLSFFFYFFGAAQSPITFTKKNISAPGTYDLALVDMNGDFLDDAVSVSSSKLYINFQDASQTSDAGNLTAGFTYIEINTPSANYLPGWSLTAGDYDSNGYTDLMYGSGSGVTFMRAIIDSDNLNNGNDFDDITTYEEVNPVDPADGDPADIFSQRGNFMDINNDGHLDAFMCHDLAPSVTFTNDGANNLLYSNDNGLADFSTGGNYASIWIDYDNDRDIDLFISKCGGLGERPKNQLYRNNGDGTFTEISKDPGVNLSDNVQTWSSAWGDYDNDGDMDVFIGSSTIPNPEDAMDPDDIRYDPNYLPEIPKNHRLLRNDNGLFTYVTLNSGVEDASVGHESLAHDFDNDGNLDIYVNGDILFGNGDLTFDIETGLTLPFTYAGAIGDLNNDGYLDLFASGSIYTNNKESNNNWIKIVTVGKSYEGIPNRSNRNGIGARVEITTPSGTQIRDVRAGEGFKYAHTLNTHFGIGTDTQINSVRVYWPSGEVDEILDPGINNTLIISESDFTLSIQETLTEDLLIYPNPVKDVLNLNSNVGLDNAIFTVFDLNGKRVLNAKLNGESIDVSQLNSGHYILRILSGESIMTQKFIKY